VKLIQSIGRALDILECLSEAPESRLALGQVAQAVGLHPATCAHLLGTMVDRGYVENLGRRKGYRLGPMAQYLVRHQPYGSELVTAARPLLEEAAETLGEWVVLTAMAGLRRLVLLELSSSARTVQVDRNALRLAERAYDSASIWLFLAYGDASRCQRFTAFHGPPEGYSDAAALEARLAEIRRDGHCLYTDRQGEVAKVAFPVWQQGVVTAAVGVHLPAFRFAGPHRAAIMKALAGLAAQLGAPAGVAPHEVPPGSSQPPAGSGRRHVVQGT